MRYGPGCKQRDRYGEPDDPRESESESPPTTPPETRSLRQRISKRNAHPTAAREGGGARARGRSYNR